MAAIKVVKQSLVDWQVFVDDKPVAWITKNGGKRMYTVTFKGLPGEYAGFRKLADAKRFIAVGAA